MFGGLVGCTALTGVTLMFDIMRGNGITGLIQYCTGPHGFGPYLKKYREASG